MPSQSQKPKRGYLQDQINDIPKALKKFTRTRAELENRKKFIEDSDSSGSDSDDIEPLKDFGKLDDSENSHWTNSDSESVSNTNDNKSSDSGQIRGKKSTSTKKQKNSNRRKLESDDDDDDNNEIIDIENIPPPNQRRNQRNSNQIKTSIPKTSKTSKPKIVHQSTVNSNFNESPNDNNATINLSSDDETDINKDMEQYIQDNIEVGRVQSPNKKRVKRSKASKAKVSPKNRKLNNSSRIASGTTSTQQKVQTHTSLDQKPNALPVLGILENGPTGLGLPDSSVVGQGQRVGLSTPLRRSARITSQRTNSQASLVTPSPSKRTSQETPTSQQNSNSQSEVDHLNESFSHLQSPAGSTTNISIKIAFNSNPQSQVRVKRKSAYFYQQVLEAALKKYKVPFEKIGDYKISNGGNDCEVSDCMNFNTLEEKYLISRWTDVLRILYVEKVALQLPSKAPEAGGSATADGRGTNQDPGLARDPNEIKLKIQCSDTAKNTTVTINKLTQGKVRDLKSLLVAQNADYFGALLAVKKQIRTTKKIKTNPPRDKPGSSIRQQLIDKNMQVYNAYELPFKNSCQYKKLYELISEQVEKVETAEITFKLQLIFDGDELDDGELIGEAGLDCEDDDIFEVKEVKIEQKLVRSTSSGKRKG